LYQSYSSAGNTRLKPENSRNLTLNLNKQHSWGQSKISFYNTTVENIIDYQNAACSDGSAITYPFPTYAPTCVTGTLIPALYVNEDQLNTKGFELSLNAQLGDYQLDFSHHYVSSQKNNTPSLRRPKLSSSFSVSRQFLDFSLRMQLLRKSSSLDTNNITLPSYTLFNASGDYQINEDAKVLLHIDNVFNKKYTLAQGYNQAGRSVKLGINYDF
jgi:outer membrane cobalamin receptor